jgi:hypothetical protein
MNMAEDELARVNKDEIQGHHLTIDVVSTEGRPKGVNLRPFMGQQYANFAEMKEALAEEGYEMRTPDRDDRYDKNRAGADIYRNGVRVGTLSFKADVDLTQGPILDERKPRLGEGKKRLGF